MKTLSHATILGVLTALALVGLVVLAATGHAVPDVLPAVALAGLSALAGLAIPSGTGGAALVAADAPADVPAPADPPAPAAPVALDAGTVVRGGYGRPVE